MVLCPKKSLAAVLAAGIVGLALGGGPARAQEGGFPWLRPGFKDSYFGLDAGGYYVADNTDEVGYPGGLGDADTTLSATTSYGASLRFGATGYDLVRAEFELAYLRAPIDDISAQIGATPASDNADGFLNAQTALAWTYYDALQDGRFSPILGVGAGLGRAGVDIEAQPSGTSFDLQAGGLAFAWGFAGGASYRMTERLELELLYRSRHTWQRDFEASVGGSDEDYGVSVQAHTLSLGLRYPFGADG